MAATTQQQRPFRPTQHNAHVTQAAELLAEGGDRVLLRLDLRTSSAEEHQRTTVVNIMSLAPSRTTGTHAPSRIAKHRHQIKPHKHPAQYCQATWHTAAYPSLPHSLSGRRANKPSRQRGSRPCPPPRGGSAGSRAGTPCLVPGCTHAHEGTCTRTRTRTHTTTARWQTRRGRRADDDDGAVIDGHSDSKAAAVSAFLPFLLKRKEEPLKTKSQRYGTAAINAKMNTGILTWHTQPRLPRPRNP
jgi:hypothetical protein